MRVFTRLLFVMLFLLVTPAAFAQVLGDGGDVFSVEGISDGCGSTINADECMFGDSSWSSTICTSSACPACAFDETHTRSICFYLDGNSGYCSFKGGPLGTAKYGNKFANCTTSGSCVAHRR